MHINPRANAAMQQANKSAILHEEELKSNHRVLQNLINSAKVGDEIQFVKQKQMVPKVQHTNAVLQIHPFSVFSVSCV